MTDKAERLNWNEQPDDVHEAYQNYKNALYDAMIFADRYSKSLNHFKPENGAQSQNVAVRSGHADLAETILRQLYTAIR